MTLIALATAFALSGQAAPPPRAGSDLTRDLNSAPTAAPSPAPQTSSSSSSRPSAAAPVAPAARPTVPASSSPTAPASPAVPAALDAAGIAALPFRIELPTGVVMVPGRAGADAAIYRIQRGDLTLAMIYAGPSSQFPIYDGDMIRTGGRTSMVVNEGGRRLAMEHLFQRASAPKEIHVWVASVVGADRDLAERIGQSVDPR